MQHFAPVPEDAWNYPIGGYAVCEKWLRDRTERRLELEDIRTYCRMVTAIGQTLQLPKQMDTLYPEVEKTIPFPCPFPPKAHGNTSAIDTVDPIYYCSSQKFHILIEERVMSQIPGAEKKMVAGILGILLGSFGIHKFYLGMQKEGLIMLLVSLVGGVVTCGAAAGIMGLIGLIEGIIYLTKSDEEFVNLYINQKKGWF